MKALVVDASVAAKWMLREEPLAEVAEHLYDRILDGSVQAIAPDLFWPEMANFFWRAVMRGRMAVAKAEADLADLRLLDLVTVASAGLCEQALRWSVEFEHPAYDMVYAALAADLGIEVVTADERFVRAVGSRLPVRWLGTAIV